MTDDQKDLSLLAEPGEAPSHARDGNIAGLRSRADDGLRTQISGLPEAAKHGFACIRILTDPAKNASAVGSRSLVHVQGIPEFSIEYFDMLDEMLKENRDDPIYEDDCINAFVASCRLFRRHPSIRTAAEDKPSR